MPIYRMTNDDFISVLELNEVILPGEEPWDDKHFKAIFFHGLCFTSRDETGKMNGYIFAKPNRTGGGIHISRLGVLSDSPRHVIDARLLACAIKYAQKIYDCNHDRTLTVTVRKDAITEIALYQQYSFYVSERVTVPELQMMTRPLYLLPKRQYKIDPSSAFEYSTRNVFPLDDDRTMPHRLDEGAAEAPFSYFSRDSFFSISPERRVEGDELESASALALA
jgi:ribosomal protein S18 acetylase RimI-like enzyme